MKSTLALSKLTAHFIGAGTAVYIVGGHLIDVSGDARFALLCCSAFVAGMLTFATARREDLPS
jgi:hypothetical protein